MTYKTGDQPCQDFNSQREGFWDGNKHDCYCKDKNGDHCKLSVSFCSNCSTDHHEKGYENCVCNTEALAKQGVAKDEG